jgi:uncharacterized membrane protein
VQHAHHTVAAGTARRDASAGQGLIAIPRTLLALAGLLISGYLVATHYFADQVPLACATGGIVDCEQVTTSAQSMVGPVPVAVLGLVWFGVFVALSLVRHSRASSPLTTLELVWAIAGLLSVFYFVYAELFLIGAICVWCTAIHAIVVVLFLACLWEATAVEAKLTA